MTERTASRRAEVARETRETRARAILDLDRSGEPVVETGLPFLDHMLCAALLHGRVAADVSCRGDLEVDDHHTVEDTALVLGGALREALGDRSGIRRFGSAYAPLDEALARVVIDLSGRPHATVDLGLRGERLGDVACENLDHFFRSLAVGARATLHVDVLRGENDHHRAEAAFKALGLALREAVSRTSEAGVPSTKGVLA